ncbi:galactokinase [soil metagenome]
METSDPSKGETSFIKDFNPEIKVASPGRINLIGEHTDYNMGFVMPTAIDKKIYFELRKNGHPSKCNIHSATFNAGFTFDLNSFEKSSKNWENYILGVINEIHKLDKTLQGFDCIIQSELPIGAGISSSAALECGLATGLNSLFNLKLSGKDIVFLSQAAENNFVGSQCGIMDQYASVLSKEGNLILLDCLHLEAEYIPATFENCKILLINTKVSHSLADGEYNTRRRECETALEIIKQHYTEVKTLRDVTKDMLTIIKEKLSEKQTNRVLYVLEENQRVLRGSDYLKEGDLREFGELMFQSHDGLKNLYEVSCPELDFLVDFVKDKDFVYGARMMGGGFGGCTINIIEKDKIEKLENELVEAYETAFGIKPEFITVFPSGGTEVEELRKVRTSN